MILHCACISFISFRKFMFIISFFIFYWGVVSIYCCCLVAKLCLTLCSPMNCSPPGFPVLRCLLEFAQTDVRWVSDAVQPSHPPFLSGFPSGSGVTSPHAVQEAQAWSLDWKDPLDKEMAIYSSIAAWEIPWTEEPGGHDWGTNNNEWHISLCWFQVYSEKHLCTLPSEHHSPKLL